MAAVIGFAGFSGSGKTTLATQVVGILRGRGVRVAVVKHDGHGHYKEAEGSDSAQYIVAGAQQVVVVSPGAVVTYEARVGMTLDEQLGRMVDCDVVLVEGFKGGTHAKIAVFRDAEQAEVLERLANVVAIVAPPKAAAEALGGTVEAGVKATVEEAVKDAAVVPIFAPDDVKGVADFVFRFAGLEATESERKARFYGD
jgi:molybdopterin-guanine dinucleotide biosynthesis protein B